MLPFNQHEFFDLFERYNEAIWPLQVFAYVLGVISVLATPSSQRFAGAICLSSLALLWGWTGVGYHWVFFSSINPIAPVFGAAFVSQALILAFAAIRRPPQFSARSNVMTMAGWGLIAYAAVFYPVLNTWLGHPYPGGPSFGVTPCPLVIFTFGVLLLSSWRVSWIMFIVPCAWSVIGGSAAFLLDVVPDLAMPISAVLALVMNARKPARRQG